MSTQNLPERTVKYKFPKTPLITEPDYDPTNVEHVYGAKVNQLVERHVISAEMTELAKETHKCVLTHGVNARYQCRSLSAEYWRRINCPHFVCEDDPRYHIMDPQLIKKGTWFEADQSLEENFKFQSAKLALDRFD